MICVCDLVKHKKLGYTCLVVEVMNSTTFKVIGLDNPSHEIPHWIISSRYVEKLLDETNESG